MSSGFMSSHFSNDSGHDQSSEAQVEGLNPAEPRNKGCKLSSSWTQQRITTRSEAMRDFSKDQLNPDP